MNFPMSRNRSRKTHTHTHTHTHIYIYIYMFNTDIIKEGESICISPRQRAYRDEEVSFLSRVAFFNNLNLLLVFYILFFLYMARLHSKAFLGRLRRRGIFFILSFFSFSFFLFPKIKSRREMFLSSLEPF
jgi:hypothetical protein